MREERALHVCGFVLVGPDAISELVHNRTTIVFHRGPSPLGLAWRWCDEVESVMAIQKKMLIGNLIAMLTISVMLAVAPVAAQSGDQRIRSVAHVRSLPDESPPPAEPELEPMWTAPASGRVSSVFGSRWGSMHCGVDIANAIGTPIFAAASGTVVDSGPASGYGRWVRIQHPDGIITVYGHIHESLVQVGQQVERGQHIAAIGNRGQSTGPHLHFQLEISGKPVDPVAFYESRSAPLIG